MTSPALTTPPRRLVALDVETADDKHQQICSIALVMIEDGKITGEWSSLVCPPEPPDPANVAVHGLSWDKLHDQPTFGEVWPTVLGLLDGVGAVVAHYAKFDRAALGRQCAALGLAEIALTWVCTVELGRLAWPKPSVVPNHQLPTLAAHLGLALDHHDALSDARACARIYLEAGKRLGGLRPGLNALLDAPAPPPPVVAGEERVGTDGRHAWRWDHRAGASTLGIDGRLLLEVLQGSAHFEVRVFGGSKALVFRSILAPPVLSRADSVLVDALRAAVLVVRNDWRLTLSPAAWKKIVDGRPDAAGRAAA